MRTMRMTAAALAILAVSGLSLTAPALAQTAGQAASGWQVEITPYVWLTGISGDIRAGQTSTSVGVSFGDILNSLDFGLMGMFQVRKGRVGFVFDGMYARLAKDGLSSGGAGQDVHAEITTQLYSTAVVYRVLAGRVPLDIGGGVRIMPVSADLRMTSGVLEGRQASGSHTGLDGFVAARLTVPMASRWALEVYADVGTGDSKLSWQALGGLKFQLSRTVSAKLGYRSLSIENETPDLRTEFTQGGFYIGVGIRL